MAYNLKNNDDDDEEEDYDDNWKRAAIAQSM
jgi:hypothetical protein